MNRLNVTIAVLDRMFVMQYSNVSDWIHGFGEGDHSFNNNTDMLSIRRGPQISESIRDSGEVRAVQVYLPGDISTNDHVPMTSQTFSSNVVRDAVLNRVINMFDEFFNVRFPENTNDMEIIEFVPIKMELGQLDLLVMPLRRSVAVQFLHISDHLRENGAERLETSGLCVYKASCPQLGEDLIYIPGSQTASDLCPAIWQFEEDEERDEYIKSMYKGLKDYIAAHSSSQATQPEERSFQTGTMYTFEY